MSAHFLAMALNDDIPFDPDEITMAEKLLENDRSDIRYSAMCVLRPRYLNEIRIKDHCERLSRDPEEHIRERAFAFLDEQKKKASRRPE